MVPLPEEGGPLAGSESSKNGDDGNFIEYPASCCQRTSWVISDACHWLWKKQWVKMTAGELIGGRIEIPHFKQAIILDILGINRFTFLDKTVFKMAFLLSFLNTSLLMVDCWRILIQLGIELMN